MVRAMCVVCVTAFCPTSWVLGVLLRRSGVGHSYGRPPSTATWFKLLHQSLRSARDVGAPVGWGSLRITVVQWVHKIQKMADHRTFDAGCSLPIAVTGWLDEFIQLQAQAQAQASTSDSDPPAPGAMYLLKRYLSTTGLGVAIDLVDLALSMTFCAAYVAETYTTQMTDDHIRLNIVCTVAFIAYFVLCVAISPSRVHFLVSLSSILDIVSVLPIIPLLLADGERTFLVQILRLGVVARISHLEALDRMTKTEIDRQVFM